MHARILRTLLIAGVLIAVVAPARADKPADMAAAMPADTLLYVGWSQMYAPDSPEVQIGKQIAGMLGDIEEFQDALNHEEAAAVTLLLDSLEALLTGSGGLGLIDVSIAEGQPNVELALVVKAGADNQVLLAAIDKFLATMKATDDVVEQQIGGAQLKGITPPNDVVHFVWGTHKDHFLLTLGEAAAGKVVACLDGKTPNLAGAPEMKLGRERVKARLDGRYLCVFGDVQRVISRGKEIAGAVMGEVPPIVDQAIEELGLATYRSKYFHIEHADGVQRMGAFAHVDGPLKGIFSLWQQNPMTDDDLKVVPENAYWMQAGNLDVAKLWAEITRIVGELAPDALPMVEGSVAMAAPMLGFSLTNDFLPALGDTWVLYDSPDHGGVFMAGTVLVAEAADADALHGMLARSVQILTPVLAQQDVTLRHVETTHAGHTIHYLLIGGVPAPVAPAWGSVGNRFVFGVAPQTVATALKQVDPKTRGESILDNPTFKAARKQLPKDVVSVGYYDSKYFARLIYPLLTAVETAGVSMLGKYGVDIDLEMFPPLPERVEDTTNYVGTSSVVDDGILYASVGDGTPLAVIAAGGATAASLALPAMSQSRAGAKRAVSMSNLRGIGMACRLYANDHNEEYPASLDTLLEEGMITSQTLQSPYAPGRTDSYVYIAGQSVGSDSRNVVVYELVENEDAATVLFGDGHCEYQHMHEFKQALRDTYTRLGREDEIPPWAESPEN